MDKLFNWVSVSAAVVGGTFGILFGGFDKMLIALLIIMAVDYITGVIKAIYNKKLSSEIGFKGLLKKTVLLAVVVLSNTLQELTGGEIEIRSVVIMFYIANEGISILENVAAVSDAIPPGLKEVLLQLRDRDAKKE